MSESRIQRMWPQQYMSNKIISEKCVELTLGLALYPDYSVSKGEESCKTNSQTDKRSQAMFSLCEAKINLMLEAGLVSLTSKHS